MPISIEDKQKARKTNLIEFCEKNNYELKPEKNGDYRVVGYNGLFIKDNMFYRYSTNESGQAIDFCVGILGMHFKDAIEALLDVDSVVNDMEGARLRLSLAKQEKKGEFILPNKSGCNSLFAYLCKIRGIKMKTIRNMLDRGLLYQDDNNNCVFPCYDIMRNPKGAIFRGTYNEKAFKGRAAHSDMNYGWVVAPGEYCERVIIVEAPIDAMSLMDMYPNRVEKNYLLAMGGLHLDMIMTFLKENKQVASVVLALDNDAPAKEFIVKVKSELEPIYHVNEFLPKVLKDWNELLMQKRIT
ncbi:DUF3991 and TOPRIM domain-containing protein [Paenibacillus sp. FSL H7-0331]|uniref:DUF3991 and TOPRIM domain-containing protein n=1 Tax=Paenibacillus sp. FSL H7-0331 TaxID=1920421 RepID=UPI00096D01AC|nr:DUF3991 and TOPRIM domain-containing protein [Paenibacillus sp. FSL H7-0331]OMF04881.1 hypothetical protein BK127_32995 [Paenibacillus sp. FSL H7-0331]